MHLYEKRIRRARKEFLNLNLKQEKELLRIYKELAKQVLEEIYNCKTDSKDEYLRELNKNINIYIDSLNSKLNETVKSNIESSSQIACSSSLAYYENLTDEVKLKTMFNKSVLQTGNETVKKLIQGKYYEDGKTLDQRIWNITRKNAKDIDTLIKVNVLKGANARELAEKVDNYVNPSKRTDAKTLISGMNKNVCYEAQRLARTSITHAFAETTIESAKKNPFNKGIKWNLSSSHGIRMKGRIDICDDYAGKVFKPNDIPIQHPCCLCYFTEENEDIDKAIKELKEWSNGKSNHKLDKWYNEYNNSFEVIETPKSKPIKWSEFDTKRIEFNNKKEIKNHLKDNYNIKFSDSTKYPINKDILQDSINWLDKFHGYFKGFKEINPVELPTFKVKASSNSRSVGYYSYYINKPKAEELVLNAMYFTDKEYSSRYVEQCVKSKWTVANAKPHKTFIHEYGHHVADSLKWLDKSEGIASENWCNDFMIETIKEYNSIYDKDVTFRDIGTLVSRYGGSKPEEAFAEAFAEYFGGDNPREFAKIFGEKVEKKIKEYIEIKKC